MRSYKEVNICCFCEEIKDCKEYTDWEEIRNCYFCEEIKDCTEIEECEEVKNGDELFSQKDER